MSLKELLTKEDTRRITQELNAKYHDAEQRQKIAKQNLELEQSKQQQQNQTFIIIIVVMVLVLITILFTVVYYNNKAKTKQRSRIL